MQMKKGSIPIQAATIQPYMPNSKTYLTVPYAEKDAAKALGAKWDAAKKKWYVPSDKDITHFTKWQTKSTVAVSKMKKSASNILTGITTYAKDKDFVAYDGEKPPWD